jgi:hypothetical protein
MSPCWVANIAITGEHLAGTSPCGRSGIAGSASTVYQVGSYQIKSISATERLCWKPSINGNICQHRDQAKDALAFAGVHLSTGNAVRNGPPLGAIRRQEGCHTSSMWKPAGAASGVEGRILGMVMNSSVRHMSGGLLLMVGVDGWLIRRADDQA